MVRFDVLVACHTLPLDFATLGLKPPAVVKASGRGSMTTVNKEALRLWVGLWWVNCNVLGSGNWLVSRAFLLSPGRLSFNSKLAKRLKEAANTKFK